MSLKICSLYSGSSGNSTLIASSKSNRILIDCGVSLRAEEIALSNVGVRPESIRGIFITHEHTDHIKSAGALSRKYNIPIYANESTWKAMADKVGPVSPSNLRYVKTGSDLYLEDLCIDIFPISHDAAEPVGYTVSSGTKKVSVVTDLGIITEKVLDAVVGSQLVLLEANHDREMLQASSYPAFLKQRISGKKGHLSNCDCAQTTLQLMDKGVKYILLSHLSKESNTPELAFGTVSKILEDAGVYIGTDIMVDMTWRDRSTHVYNLL